jgi:hypothetical protein
MKTSQCRAGRALRVQSDGTMWIGHRFTILRSKDGGAEWQRVTTMPGPLYRRLASTVRLGARLLRHEVKDLVVLSDGAIIAANRQSVYRAGPGEPVMQKASIEDCGDRGIWAPMQIAVGPNDRIVWGEYGGKSHHGLPVRLFASDDGGRSYQLAYTFEGGVFRHVHNIIYDARMRGYWLLVGDHDDDPGIALLSEDLKQVDWVVKGKQSYRAVCAFDFGDYLVYATDTEKEPNAVMTLDKATGRTERRQELDGSCIYACRFGRFYVLSTSIEPSELNLNDKARLWCSTDGDRWEPVFDVKKDRWHATYFQFGSLVLPDGETESETIMFSGQALQGIDGKVLLGRWDAQR